MSKKQPWLNDYHRRQRSRKLKNLFWAVSWTLLVGVGAFGAFYWWLWATPQSDLSIKLVGSSAAAALTGGLLLLGVIDALYGDIGDPSSSERVYNYLVTSTDSTKESKANSRLVLRRLMYAVLPLALAIFGVNGSFGIRLVVFAVGLAGTIGAALWWHDSTLISQYDYPHGDGVASFRVIPAVILLVAAFVIVFLQ
ncbi:MAG: hypothetical protein JXQ72_06445 [Anaerolineae bacterium]|nr:hypothetical protein [Anaerolineae bacterium]